jgi:CheY-like chemotaxis protein
MGKIILVVDDDADDRDLFREALLEVDGDAQFLSANNGHDAIELLSYQQALIPDFIFLDLNMPRIDGRECLIRLRKMPWLLQVPIIIFTTLKPSLINEEFTTLGAAYCLSKPLLFADLKKTIQLVIAPASDPARIAKR